MMNDQVVIAVANAITAQSETLKALIESLSEDVRTAVAEKVTVPAVTPIPAPVVPAAAVVPVAPAVAATPTAPIPVAPVAPVALTASNNCPITDTKTLMNYTMGRYKTLGPIKGSEIQGVLTELGYNNINDVKAEHYESFYVKCEAIK